MDKGGPILKSCFTCTNLYMDPDSWEMPWTFFWECSQRTYNNKWRNFPFLQTECEAWNQATPIELRSRMTQAIFVLRPQEWNLLKNSIDDVAFIKECESLRAEIISAYLSHAPLRRAISAMTRSERILQYFEGISNPVMAEIGVCRANLSRVLLRECPQLTLYMVDPWSSKPSQDYIDTGDDHALYEEEQHNANYNIAFCVAMDYAPQAHLYRGFSQTVAPDFENNSLDLVYIDADHSYKGCKTDIALWYPKVKPLGYIGGHDYGTFPGVTKAVNEHFPHLDHTSGLEWFKQKPKQKEL